MPTKRISLFALSFIFIVYLAACTPTSTPTPTVDQAAAVATIVAATQTALAEGQTPTAVPTLQPNEKPTPSTFIPYIKNGTCIPGRSGS